MDTLKIDGVIIKRFPTEQITETFKKREFILHTKDEKYPQKIKFELTQDKTDLLDDITKPTPATIYFNIRGREWTNNKNEFKYFVSLNAWKIETTPELKEIPAAIIKETPPITSGFADELPF